MKDADNVLNTETKRGKWLSSGRRPL